ncbi:andropin [Drosophila mauritiana]|uniref:Andropin n=2 Tax=Drosophila mauritiana TaxID=7226 RepID=ANDP_DROMA|nr:andropin [Drosophila mauritiana]O16825.2 RecName: Full=Andropin; Flags: Precursor [Drosophila mauritiana]
MKYFVVLVVLALILAITVGPSDAVFIDILDKMENAIHKAAQAGIGIAKPIEKMILPK